MGHKLVLSMTKVIYFPSTILSRFGIIRLLSIPKLKNYELDCGVYNTFKYYIHKLYLFLFSEVKIEYLDTDCGGVRRDDFVQRNQLFNKIEMLHYFKLLLSNDFTPT